MRYFNSVLQRPFSVWGPIVSILLTGSSVVENVNDYIKFKILEYKHFKFINDDLWELYKEDFTAFTKATFKACNTTNIRNLQTLLRHHSV
jgi:hypothetical protein